MTESLSDLSTTKGDATTAQDVQQRLADRLRSAAEPGAALQWLAVEAGPQGLLLPLRQTAEVFAPVPMQPVPRTRPWVCGVAPLRGGLFTVVDLAAFLGLRARPANEPGQQRLVALHPDLACPAALRVDRLVGLRAERQMQVQPGQQGQRPSFAGPLMHDEAGRPWQVLDLEALARHPDFLHIAA